MEGEIPRTAEHMTMTHRVPFGISIWYKTNVKNGDCQTGNRHQLPVNSRIVLILSILAFSPSEM
jgi:hypothetical protein